MIRGITDIYSAGRMLFTIDFGFAGGQGPGARVCTK